MDFLRLKGRSAGAARTGRLYPCRHEFSDDALEAEPAKPFVDSPIGPPPVALALVTLLQAADGVSDAAAVIEVLFDRRWQRVHDCLDLEEAPFLLGNFRRRLVAPSPHQRLGERSVKSAQRTGDFGFRQLRVALDSAPQWWPVASRTASTSSGRRGRSPSSVLL